MQSQQEVQEPDCPLEVNESSSLQQEVQKPDCLHIGQHVPNVQQEALKPELPFEQQEQSSLAATMPYDRSPQAKGPIERQQQHEGNESPVASP